MTMPLSNQSDSNSIDQAFTVSVAVSASLKEKTFWSFAHLIFFFFFGFTYTIRGKEIVHQRT